MGIHFGIILEPFGIIARHFFGINLLTFGGMPFSYLFVENGRQNNRKTYVQQLCFVCLLALQGPPKMLKKRIRDATMIFHRFGIDFGGRVADICQYLVVVFFFII